MVMTITPSSLTGLVVVLGSYGPCMCRRGIVMVLMLLAEEGLATVKGGAEEALEAVGWPASDFQACGELGLVRASQAFEVHQQIGPVAAKVRAVKMVQGAAGGRGGG